MNKTIRYAMLTVICITAFTGCSSSIVKALAGDKPSVEANVNVGKNVKQDKAAVKIETGTTAQTADNISNDTSYKAKTINQISQDVPPYIIILLVLAFGWLIPDPLQTYKGFKFLLYDITQSFFVVPGKAVLRFFRFIK